MSDGKRYHRVDIVEAARKRFGSKPALVNGGRSHGLALEEVNGELRIRTVGGPMRELVVDGVKHLIEQEVKVYAGPFNSLAEAAKYFGVKPR